MRWLRGGTLERRLDDGPLTVGQAIAMAQQVGGALATAHAHGVIHRDVKAANILFDEQDNAFLADFGIALEATKSGGSEAALSPGSPAYASPEQIRRERLGPEADVFSLGVVIFECLTGSLPFPDSSSVEELVERQLHTPFPSLSELRPNVPIRIADAVARATAKDPTERHGSIEEFLDALAAEADATTSRPAAGRGRSTLLGADLTNPYQGLRAFDGVDADQFFGRERLVDELVSRMADSTLRARCLVVVGPSGSGKSSVVRAGLTPALRAGAVPGSSDWFVTTMVPGADPFESLEAALLRVAVNPPPSLLEQLRDDKRGVLRSLRRCLGSEEDKVLVVVDQFEEVFTSGSNQDAFDFLDALSVAVEDPTSPLRLVLTLRADYYGRPLTHPVFASVLKEAAVDVTPLAPDELERAIVEPARQLGVEFEPGLVARITAETVGQLAPLPLLQYTLSELFERRNGPELTIEAYDDIGGLTGALAARAEALYAEADDSQRGTIRRVFGRMTNPGEEAADLRRRVPLSDLGDDPATEWVLEQFGAARLVTFDRDVASREPTVEVAHEALLREWPRLVAWLAEDLEILRSADAIGAAATSWDDGGCETTDLYRGVRLQNAVDLALTTPDRLRPIDSEFIEASRTVAEAERHSERRRIRRLRRLVAGVGVALVIALIAGAAAIREQSRANDEAARAGEEADRANESADQEASARQLAEEQTAAAELAGLISLSAAVAVDDEELSILLALEAHRRSPGLDTEQAVLNALGSSTLANRIATVNELEECSTAGVWLDHGMATEFVSTEDQLVSRDTLTDERFEHGAPPAPCVSWFGSTATDRRIAYSWPDSKMWLASFDGPWNIERQFNETTFTAYRQSFNAAHRVLLGDAAVDGSHSLFLLDDRTGESVGDPIIGDGVWVTGTMSPSGAHAAVSFARSDESGEIVVVDGATGTQLFGVDIASVSAVLAFDEITNELVAGAVDGTIATVDLATGEVTGLVRRSADSNLLDIGFRDDGQLVVVSSGLVEIVDRRSGPTGSQTKIPETFIGQLRPDGRLVIASSDGAALETYDLEASALTDTSIDVDVGAVVSNDGVASMIDPNTYESELLNIATGEREVLQPLVKPDGEVFAIAAEWEGENRLAISLDAHLARWENGEIVEEIVFGGDGTTRFVGQSRFEDRIIVATITPNGTQTIHLVDTNPGELAILATVADDDAQTFSVTPDGFIILRRDGILRMYDDTGTVVGDVATGLDRIPEGGGGSFHVGGAAVARDDVTGVIALGTLSGVVLFDPETTNVTLLPTFKQVQSVLFARDGELLLIGDDNGVVRV